MISKQNSQDPLLYLRKQCVGDTGAYRCVTSGFPLLSTHFGYITTQFGYWPGRELNPRHADFQSLFGVSRGLSINHLQRLADPFPGTPRHNPGTLNLSRSHSWQETNGTRIPVNGERASATPYEKYAAGRSGASVTASYLTLEPKRTVPSLLMHRVLSHQCRIRWSTRRTRRVPRRAKPIVRCTGASSSLGRW